MIMSARRLPSSLVYDDDAATEVSIVLPGSIRSSDATLNALAAPQIARMMAMPLVFITMTFVG